MSSICLSANVCAPVLQQVQDVEDIPALEKQFSSQIGSQLMITSSCGAGSNGNLKGVRGGHQQAVCIVCRGSRLPLCLTEARKQAEYSQVLTHHLGGRALHLTCALQGISKLMCVPWHRGDAATGQCKALTSRSP